MIFRHFARTATRPIMSWFVGPSHNGNTPPSWSSEVNLFHVYGDHTTNIVERMVSFENIDVSNAATPFFTDPAGTHPNFRLTSSAQSSIVDKGLSTNAPTTEIGFDPQCLTQGTITGGPGFWQYQVDYAYITSIGGVSACFKPSARSGAPDIGAYELASTSPGCSGAADCNDSDVCTSDACTAGACSHSAISGCGKSAADCNDANARRGGRRIRRDER